MILSRADWGDELRAALDDPGVALSYRPWDRNYAIPRILSDQIPSNAIPKRPGDPRFGWTIWFCPWSGDLLPSGLYTRYLRILRTEFKLKDIGGSRLFDDSILPEEYRSEAWWLKQGIGPRVNRKRLIREARSDWVLLYVCRPTPLYGIYRSGERPPHYCGPMSDLLDRPDNSPFIYLPFTREYGVLRFDPDVPLEVQPTRIVPFRYCPWCAERLPESLRQGWEARVRDRGLDPSRPENLPPDLLTSEWWRERGL